MARRGDGIYQRCRICIMFASLWSLLGVATSASAECAWVLWGQSAGPGGWMVIALDGWNEREACERERSRRIQQPQAPATPILLSCLPDTVDPRGPKGKWGMIAAVSAHAAPRKQQERLAEYLQ